MPATPSALPGGKVHAASRKSGRARHFVGERRYRRAQPRVNPFSFLGKRARASRANERGRALAIGGTCAGSDRGVRTRVLAWTPRGRCRPTTSDCTTSTQVTGNGRWSTTSAQPSSIPEDQAGWWNSASPRRPSAGGTLRVRRGTALDCRYLRADGPPEPSVWSDADPAEPRHRRRGRLVRPSRSGPRADCTAFPSPNPGFRFADHRPPRWRCQRIPPAGR